MKWTTDLPKKKGFYWYEAPMEGSIRALLEVTDDNDVFVMGGDCWIPTHKLSQHLGPNVKYFGPITMQEPTTHIIEAALRGLVEKVEIRDAAFDEMTRGECDGETYYETVVSLAAAFATAKKVLGDE